MLVSGNNSSCCIYFVKPYLSFIAFASPLLLIIFRYLHSLVIIFRFIFWLGSNYTIDDLLFSSEILKLLNFNRRISISLKEPRLFTATLITNTKMGHTSCSLSSIKCLYCVYQYTTVTTNWLVTMSVSKFLIVHISSWNKVLDISRHEDISYVINTILHVFAWIVRFTQTWFNIT